jgi:hypothetical protein
MSVSIALKEIVAEIEEMSAEGESHPMSRVAARLLADRLYLT